MLSKKTRNVVLLLLMVAGTVTFGLTRSAPVAGQDDADTQAKIESAMSAAPATIADQATILDNVLDDAGTFVVLREGSNGWFCSPDAVGTPGNDPWCYDQAWLDWSYAFAAGEEPTTTVLGLSYMLQGGSDASNSDPFATEPAAGEEWMASAPHVMFIVPGKLDQSVFTTDHHSGEPWIMWAGTPYEHLMMPVTDGEHQM